MNILGYLFTIGEFLPAMKVQESFQISILIFDHRSEGRGILLTFPVTARESPFQVKRVC